MRMRVPRPMPIPAPVVGVGLCWLTGVGVGSEPSLDRLVSKGGRGFVVELVFTLEADAEICVFKVVALFPLISCVAVPVGDGHEESFRDSR